MTVAEVPTNPSQLGQGARLLDRIRLCKSAVLVHPCYYGGHWRAFAYLLTDHGRERVHLAGLGVLIREGTIRVHHVFADGDLLYEVPR
jgi:hypothetical protein